MAKQKISTKKILIILLFFISGFSGLIYQILWSRQFKLLLGSSIVSVSIIVAMFMLGLLIGSWWIGKRLEKNLVKNELKYYGYLELVIGLFGLLLYFILPHTKFLFSIFGAPSIQFNYIKLIFNLILTFCLLGIPTIAMGATLPLLINYFSKSIENFRKTTSQFYSINAFGGAIASIIAGFFLIKYLGVNGSILVAIILNLTIGILAIFISLNDGQEKIKEEDDKSLNPTESKVNKITKIILLTSFLTGFIAISYEVLWIRCLNYILNNSTYTFSIILFVFLAGIAIGSIIISYLKKNINHHLLVGILQYLLSICALAIISLFYSFSSSQIFSKLFLEREDSVSLWYQDVGLNLIFSVIVFLIPAILMGMTFPLLSDMYFYHKKTNSGVAISKVYVVNTLGSILGALIPIFIFIPLFGSIKITLYIFAILNIIIAVYYTYNSHFSKKKILSVLFLTSFSLLCFNITPNSILISLESINQNQKNKPIFYKEGIMATVKVYNKDGYAKSLSIDGITIASEAFKAKESTIGHLPFLTKKPIKNVLAVGLASGSTVGSILKHKEVEHIDVVEIVPSVLDAVEYFKSVNQDVRKNPKVEIYIDDILSHLSYSKKKYDVISSDGKFSVLNKSNTTMLSKDYYQICKEHLSNKGIFIQWISTEVPNKHFNSILSTAKSVFPYSEMFLIRKNLFILSSNEPISLKYTEIVKNFNDSEVSSDLYSSNIYSPSELLSYYVGPNLNISKNEVYNTLNTPIIEYDYNVEHNNDIKLSKTSVLRNLKTLNNAFNQNKTSILNSKNSITENKSYISFNANNNFMKSRISYIEGHIAISKENTQQALNYFENVITINHPENNNDIAVSAKTIGEYHLQHKDYKKAIIYFNKAITKLDGYTDAYALRGVCYYYLNDPENCRLDMNKTLSLNPNNQTAKEFLNALKQ
ncbi:MAG: fused MFS/spermidine synthase [Vicingaceae bacterium]